MRSRINSLIRLASGYSLEEAIKITYCRRILFPDIGYIDKGVLDINSLKQLLQISSFALSYYFNHSIIEVLHISFRM